MKKLLAVLCIALMGAGFCAAQTPGATFRQEGIASWYGKEFDGRPTASGEIFNSSLYTAAHLILPFGTILTVTNQHNGKKVNVRVNDRGPFVSARIIDLSRAAAEQLDMLVIGTAPVLIEGTVNPGTNNAGVSSDQGQYSAGTNAAAISGGGWSNATSQVVTALPPAPQDTLIIQQYQPPPQPVQPVQQYQSPVQEVQQYQPLPQQIQQVQPVQQYQPPVQGVQQYQPLPQQIQPVQQVQQYQPRQPVPSVQPVENLQPVQIVTVEPAPVEPKPLPEPESISIPALTPNKVYRIQVGSYKVGKNAVEAYEKLKNAGLSPMYEPNGEYFRVVLSRIRSEDVESVARKIGAAGFGQPLFRMEK
ncbi:MAG: septal ring lytic transglycosylase RlpA family protein [Treponema sp.]|jgi:rare lipoprotein A|nr:septal ring lytic transglycosylase RlpA family protein [Treponema sp.]